MSRASRATAWFGLGVGSSWTACLLGSLAMTPGPDRWSSEGGIVASIVGSLLVALVSSSTFGAWLLLRRFGREGKCPRHLGFVLPMTLGVAHPLVSGGVAVILTRLATREAALPVAMILTFGGPIAAGEIVTRSLRHSAST